MTNQEKSLLCSMFVLANHVDALEQLLNNKKFDPSACNNYAIRYAVKNRNFEVVELLAGKLKG